MVALSCLVLLMMMSTVVCLMYVVTFGFRRLIGSEDFYISLYRGWLGVVFDGCRHASFLSDAMAIRTPSPPLNNIRVMVIVWR